MSEAAWCGFTIHSIESMFKDVKSSFGTKQVRGATGSPLRGTNEKGRALRRCANLCGQAASCGIELKGRRVQARSPKLGGAYVLRAVRVAPQSLRLRASWNGFRLER